GEVAQLAQVLTERRLCEQLTRLVRAAVAEPVRSEGVARETDRPRSGRDRPRPVGRRRKRLGGGVRHEVAMAAGASTCSLRNRARTGMASAAPAATMRPWPTSTGAAGTVPE